MGELDLETQSPPSRVRLLRHRPAWIPIVLLVLLAGVLFWLLLKPPTTMLISSGEAGSIYFDVGTKLDDLLEEAYPGFPQGRDVDFVNLPSHGAVENVTRVALGAAQLGLAEEGIEIEGLTGHSQGADHRAPSAVQHQIRTLLQLFNSPLKIVARRDLGPKGAKETARFENLGDLRRFIDLRRAAHEAPIRVFIGAEGSGTRKMSHLVLGHYDYTAQPDSDGNVASDLMIVGHDWTFDRAKKALQNGEADIAFFLTAFGSSAVRDLAKDGRFILLGVDRAEGIHRSHPFMDVVQIPAGSYPASVNFPETEINTLAVGEVLIGSSTLSDQEAYRIVATMFNHSHDLGSAFPFMVPFSKTDQLAERFYYPPHPGATAFFQGRYEPQGLVDFLQRYRDAMLGVFSFAGTAWAVFHFWLGRWRSRPLIHRLGQSTLSSGEIFEVEREASHLYATGKINKETYESVKEFVRVRLNALSRQQ